METRTGIQHWFFGSFLLMIFLVFGCEKNQKQEEHFAKSNYPPVSQDLFDEILKLDRQLFDAFHKKEIEVVNSMFSPDLEFYHDEAGLLFFEQNSQGLESMMTGETFVRRELIEKTMEVYPIHNYGAIQMAEHQFYNTIKGETEKLMGTYKFVHIWKKGKNGWKITRVVSYGH